MSDEEQKQPETAPKETKVWVVCCVCNKILQVGNIPGDRRTSHGLCDECAKKTLGEL